MTMNIDANDEILIRRYLLGLISEAELENVESRVMTDDGFFQQINLVEDELIDEYLDGDLSSKDCRAFEDIFLRAPERQNKLRFARALHTYAANAARSAASEPQAQAVPWWQPVLALLTPPRNVLAFSLATAVVAILVGGPWAYLRIAGLEQRIAALQVSRQEEAVRSLSLYQSQQVRTEQITTQLRRAQEELSAAQSGGARLSGPRVALSNTLSVLLIPGMTRSGGSGQRLEIPKNAAIVRVTLDLPENRFEAYTAVVLGDGQEILARKNLKASEKPDRITLRFDLPASDLSSGDYEIRLFGANQTDQFETYVLRVSHK